MCPKTSTEPDTYDLNTEIALFRYGLIAQLIHTPPDDGQQERLLRHLAAQTYQIPSSQRTRVSVTTLALPGDLPRERFRGVAPGTTH